MLAACTGHKEPADEGGPKPRSAVQVTTVHYGTISDNLELQGTTVYQRHDVVLASIPAYITSINCYLGKRVSKGDVLYVLMSKERKALGRDAQLIDNSLSDFGIVKLRASAPGVISTFDKQQAGDYVLEGTQLCTVGESGSLAIQVNTPYDVVSYTSPGKNCQLRLPDGSVHNAVFTTPLTSVNVPAQTQAILARPLESLFLPESLVVKVLIRKGDATRKQMLPNACVQSDEMLKNFWVMKLINDSTAIKVNVTIGNKNDTSIEILRPQFNTSDQIILNGAYGLPDTALITIAK